LNKIIPAIQSRCTRFRFAPLQDEAILERTQQIIKLEELDVTPEAIQSIIRLAKGDMRKVLNILQVH
jgi:replication factor C subunit 3/5